MARKTKPEETIVMYRVNQPGDYPLHFHPQCVDEMCPGEGEPVRVKDITMEADDTLNPDPFCNHCGLDVLDQPMVDWIYTILKRK